MHCQQSSRLPSDLMWSMRSTSWCAVTPVKPTRSTPKLVIKHQPNRGELVALSLVFREFVVAVLTVPVRVPSETCVAAVVCSRQPSHGVDGIARSASTWNATLSFRLLLLRVFQLWFKLAVSFQMKILSDKVTNLYFLLRSCYRRNFRASIGRVWQDSRIQQDQASCFVFASQQVVGRCFEGEHSEMCKQHCNMLSSFKRWWISLQFKSEDICCDAKENWINRRCDNFFLRTLSCVYGSNKHSV